MVAFPEGLEKKIKNCSFSHEADIADVVSVVDELYDFIHRLKCVCSSYFYEFSVSSPGP